MNNKKISLIVNPIAGGRDNIKFANKLIYRLSKLGWENELLITKAAGDAHEIALKKQQDSNSIIASVGGDGTFNEIASALAYSETPTALIPCGSGNGLARMVGIKGMPNAIVNYIEKGNLSKIDIGKINNNFFFCTCGFGFDAMIAQTFANSNTRGFKTYIENTIQKFIDYKGVTAKLSLDGKVIDGEFMLVTIANANQYGNNAFIAPNAEINDGWLDVTIIRKFPLIFAGAVAISLFTRQINQFHFTESYKVKEVEIIELSDNIFHRDGDYFRIKLPAKINIIPEGLNLLQPSLSMIKKTEKNIKQLDFNRLLKDFNFKIPTK